MFGTCLLNFQEMMKKGKSTTCYRFVERSETPKTTLALEYLFGRRSRNIDVDKEICHIWELGGGILFTELLEVPITAENLPSLYVVLVIDLSVPEELWFTMETLLNAIKKNINYALDTSDDPSLKVLLEEQANKRMGLDQKDENSIDPFPVPLLILGSKYDIFQDFESEKRKIICKCLRFVAYINGAALQFTSNRSENLVNKCRVSISHMVFGTAASKNPVLDYNKPLYVPFGADSLESIGAVPTTENSDLGINIHFRSLETVKKSFVSLFPQVESKNVMPDDPGSDPHFKERDINIMRDQKDKELEEYRKHQKLKMPDWE